MYYVVYLDVFLVINLFMDFLVLIICRGVIRPRTTIFRCIMGAMAGGVLSVLVLVIPWKAQTIKFITSYILICFIMCKIAFKSKGIKAYAKNMGVVYLVTFMLGGMINWLYYYTTFGLVLNKILSGAYIRAANIIRFICIALVTYVLTDILVRKFQGVNKRNVGVFDIKFMVAGKVVGVKALLDTGNMLFDPISGRNVHIIEYETVKDIIDRENDICRVIPFNSVGNEKGMLEAIEVDYIEIFDGDMMLVKLDKSLVALYDKRLASDGRFEGLLHSSIKELI